MIFKKNKFNRKIEVFERVFNLSSIFNSHYE